MSNRLVPVALPAPNDGTPNKPGTTGQRPVVGPVVPLTADTGSSDGNDLLGASGRTVSVNADPVATRVLSHGDPIAAPSGRADDFTWPRPGTDANATATADPEPVPTPAAKSPAGRNDTKKVDDSKTKPKVTPNPAAARPAPRADLDGAPRPPAPVGPAATNSRSAN
jgi:hypothetical protein